MRREGRVEVINQSRGMVAIATEDDGYTIIELIEDSDIEENDILVWENGHGLGHEIYYNETKGRPSNVYVQNHAVSRPYLAVQLRLQN